MNTILSGDAQRVISELLPATMPPRPPAAPVRPFWQTEPCPPWCTDTHRPDDFFEDRNHWAHSLDVDLNLYRTEYCGGEYGPGQLMVGLTQHYRDAEPEVDLTVPRTTPKSGPYVAEGEQGVRMSLAEARALRDRLSQILAAVDVPAVDGELLECGDNATRRGTEYIAELGHPFWSAGTIVTNLLQWHEDDGSPALEVEVMIGDNSYGATPVQARTVAQQLRIAAGNIDALADYAETANGGAR